MRKSNIPAGKPPGVRRRFRFGPGLLVAIAASLLVWRFAPPRDAGKPVVEPMSISAGERSKLSAPDPVWLWSHKYPLGLDASQVTRLQGLEGRWERDTKALRDELDRASKEFSQEGSSARRQSATIEQIRGQADPVSDLTRQLLESRRAWWEEATVVLTPAQRQQAEKAWSKRFESAGGRPAQ
jgi:hypothetical protein